MSNKNEFLQAAMAPKLVKVSVHFAPGGIMVAEQVNVITYIKQMDIRRIFYAANLKVDEIGRFAKFLREVQGLTRSEIIQRIPTALQEITGTRPTDKNAKKCAQDIFRLMKVLGVIDDDLCLTLDGEKLCRYRATNHQRFLDYIARLLLTRAGWVAVVTEIDQSRRGLLYAASMKLLTETLVENLKEKKLMKRTDSWEMSALIDCLVFLKILKPWDPIQKLFDIDLERLYDVLVRKTFT